MFVPFAVLSLVAPQWEASEKRPKRPAGSSSLQGWPSLNMCFTFVPPSLPSVFLSFLGFSCFMHCVHPL